MVSFQILVAFLLLFQPSSSAMRLQKQPPALVFPAPPPGHLPSPHQPPPPPLPSPSPQCTRKLGTEILYFRCPPQLGPPSSPHPTPAPTLPPSPVGPRPAQTRFLCYSPPPPPTIPPPPPKFSSPALSPFIVRTLSVAVRSVLSALLVAGIVGFITILIRRWAACAAPNHPVLPPNQGVHVQMPEAPFELGMQLEM